MNSPLRIGGLAPQVFGRGSLFEMDVNPGFGVDMVAFGCLDAPQWMLAGACVIRTGDLVVFPVQQVVWRGTE